MRNYGSFLGLVAVLGLSQATDAGAAGVVANGDFESGSLSGWYSMGTFYPGQTAIVSGTSGSAGYYPMGGNYSALIVAVSNAPVPPYSCLNDQWNLACPQPLPFATSSAPIPTFTNWSGVNVGGTAFLRGAYIGQDVNVLAGETLTWNWIPAGEASPNGNVDSARFFASNGSTEVFIQQSQNLHSFTFPSAGLWSIYFGLGQGEDPRVYSTLELDSIKITPVPEPATLGMFALGAVATLWAGRRKQKQVLPSMNPVA
jgi:PEP-CTERM motif